MKNLLEYILVHIVLHPEAVRVEESLGETEDIYTLHVDPEDIGRVIGRSGNVINSIRSLAKVRAMIENRRVRVIVHEADRPTPSTEPEV